MVYGLWLTLDQDRWYRDDFSSENLLTGTIYTDINKTTAKNLTGYTVTIKMHKPNTRAEEFSKTGTIVVAANGTWSYAMAESESPSAGLYWVVVKLTKSGVQESTLNRVELQVMEGI